MCVNYPVCVYVMCVWLCVCVFAEGLSHLHNAVSTLLQSYITLSAEVSNIPVHCSSYNYPGCIIVFTCICCACIYSMYTCTVCET